MPFLYLGGPKGILIKSLSLISLHLSSLSLAGAAPKASSERETQSTIDQVILFADRAEITRTLPYKCARKGEGIGVIFDDLPSTIDRRTLRGAVNGRAQVIGVSNNTRPLTGGEEVGARARTLRDLQYKLSLKARALKDAQLLAQDERKRLDHQASVLSASMNRGLSTSKVNIKGWSAALDYLKVNRTKLLNRQLKHKREFREIQLEQERLKSLFPKISADPKDHSIFAIISLKCVQAERGVARLSYVIPGGTWRPEYTLRLSSKSKQKVGRGQLEMNVGASIRQSTGEDWTNVRVLLSTAEPKLGASAPKIDTLKIRGRESDAQKVLVQAQEDRKQLSVGGTAQLKSPTDTSTPFEDRGQSFVLKLPRRMTILADGQSYWTPVHTYKTTADLSLLTIPKLSPYVFQMARFSNPAPHPLLSGLTHIYRAGAYIGDGSLEYKGEGEDIEISLGIDSSLKVTRASLLKKDREGGVLSSDRTLIRSYQVEVSSQSRQSLVVNVRENIPISKVRELEVEVDQNNTTRGYKFDKYRGFLDWSLKLKPRQSKRVKLYYHVKVPQSWTLSTR